MSTPHIQAEPGQIASTVLMPGDPLLAKWTSTAGAHLSGRCRKYPKTECSRPSPAPRVPRTERPRSSPGRNDPLLAKYIAEHFLENPVQVNSVRNMLGRYNTTKEDTS